MRIQTDFTDDILRLQLCGELDEHNASLARLEADRIADDYAFRSKSAVFDLKEVSFMDSTGIGFLIGRYKKFRRYGVPVYLKNPSLATDKILLMSGVYALMPKI